MLVAAMAGYYGGALYMLAARQQRRIWEMWCPDIGVLSRRAKYKGSRKARRAQRRVNAAYAVDKYWTRRFAARGWRWVREVPSPPSPLFEVVGEDWG